MAPVLHAPRRQSCPSSYRRCGGSPAPKRRRQRRRRQPPLESANQLGYLKEVPVVDKEGKPTGRVDLLHDGEGGMTGYLVWLGKNNPAAYAPLLARVLPLQVNQSVEHASEGRLPDRRRGSRCVDREAR